MEHTKPGDLLSLNQVAEILGVTYRTAIDLVYRDDLVAVKIGGVWRIHRRDLEQFISTGSVR